MWISEWKGDPIVSTVLIEYPAFHAAERSTLWLIRIKSRAFYWESVQADWHSDKRIAEHTQKKEIKPDAYDKFLKTVSSWKQADPLKPKEPVGDLNPEFWGFFNVFTEQTSRQMLLGIEDFTVCESKECKKAKAGRLMAALSPILLDDEDRKSSKPSN